MSDDMVARVARALNACRAVPLSDWREWERFARAAIAAMREPTPEMVSAGDACDGATVYDDNTSAETHYRAMIDAALASNV